MKRSWATHQLVTEVAAILLEEVRSARSLENDGLKLCPTRTMRPWVEVCTSHQDLDKLLLYVKGA